MMDFKSSYEVLLRHKYFWSENFEPQNDGTLKIFGNLDESLFSMLILSKLKEYYKLIFADRFICTNM